MTFDPQAQAAAVTRELRTEHNDGNVERTLVLRRTFATEQAALWEALTKPARTAAWLHAIRGDLRVGGRYEDDFYAHGVIEECDAPSGFYVTRETGKELSWVRVTLTPVAGGTELELSHIRHIDWDDWAKYGPCMDGVVWDFNLLNISRYVASGNPLDPAEADEFTHTPAGNEFVRHSTDSWAQAAIADGDDSQAALNQALRAFTFFTVIPTDEELDEFDD